MRANDVLELDIRKQDNLRYGWNLSRADGRVVDNGVELYIADCLAIASVGLDLYTRLSVTVGGRRVGEFVAARTQWETSDVAREIAQALLTRRT